MTVAAFAMKGPALTWWLGWHPRHPWMNWDAFTSVFLWQFKPEWRVILPLPDDEEGMEFEPEQLTVSIVEQSSVVEEGISDFNQHSSSLEVADLEIADSIEDSLPENENQDGENKIQPHELLTEGLNTIPAVVGERKDLITAVSKDRDVRLDFDFIFSVPNLVCSSCFTLVTFAPVFVVPSTKATVNTTSTTSPQHLVTLLDPGGYFNLQESWTTNRTLPLPPKPPDRSCYNVSIPHYIQIPLQYENNHQVCLLKKLGLNVPTNELVWVHDHLLMVISPNHYNFYKLIIDVDLMNPLKLTKDAIEPLIFHVNVVFYKLFDYVKLGERVVNYCIEVRPGGAGLCFLLLVTYATVGIWKDAKQLWLGGAAMKCFFCYGVVFLNLAMV
ncbi:hypothetical protein TSUD_201030 [Trifolium subterraneum]|uniref:Uncharacterized protein n=1 Tax=Trifolium subterraneum TaxID=3900 RepID=A0A2Z6LQ67_TRISU|nr:hypothetical protein TSUD_201030 [Trifolium subterraneum]